MKPIFAALLGLALVLFQPARTEAETRLIMFDEEGCSWCEQWKAEVGVIYAKTAEGKVAPLTVLDVHDPVPEKLKLNFPPRYTPTFILMQNDVEIYRIEGYPGEDFFWGLLEAKLIDISALKVRSCNREATSGCEASERGQKPCFC